MDVVSLFPGSGKLVGLYICVSRMVSRGMSGGPTISVSPLACPLAVKQCHPFPGKRHALGQGGEVVISCFFPCLETSEKEDGVREVLHGFRRDRTFSGARGGHLLPGSPLGSALMGMELTPPPEKGLEGEAVSRFDSCLCCWLKHSRISGIAGSAHDSTRNVWSFLWCSELICTSCSFQLSVDVNDIHRMPRVAGPVWEENISSRLCLSACLCMQ